MKYMYMYMEVCGFMYMCLQASLGGGCVLC